MATITFLRRSDNKNVGSIGSVIAYCVQEKKTKYMNAKLISGINCLLETAMKEFIATKKRWNKTDGVQFYHAVQSFGNGENVNPYLAHSIAREWAERCYPNHEILIATHTDTDNIHSHIIINSVNMNTGYKIHQNGNDIKDIVGESADDNISGMHFNREGINEIYNAVENKKIDAVIVKDLSRLGRHRTQTALFIDYLRENDVRVLSVTENIDTSNEDDDLMVGFKGIFNDMYARDISKKIRAGYKQKQKEGIILIPPMGYYKDKNTGEVVILDEAAEIVKRIFKMFLDGYGMKNIAHLLNAEGIKSAGYYQNQTIGKKHGYNKPEIANRYLWNGSGIKRILTNEFYMGTLICHKSYTSKINHIRKDVPQEEQYVHENFVPAIISKDTFEKVQAIIESKKRTNVRASSGKLFHRYVGLIKCAECGSVFVCKTRKKNSEDRYYEYVCNGYHRYGKEHCTSHRIRESDLDKIIYNELLNIRDIAKKNCQRIDKEFQKWKANKGTTETKIADLKLKLEQRRQDQQDIMLERIRDKARAYIYSYA